MAINHCFCRGGGGDGGGGGGGDVGGVGVAGGGQGKCDVTFSRVNREKAGQGPEVAELGLTQRYNSLHRGGSRKREGGEITHYLLKVTLSHCHTVTLSH